METKAEIVEQVYRKIKMLTASQSVERYEFDEVMIMIDATKGMYPKRFIDLALSLDESFPSTASGRKRAMQRLNKIGDVYLSLPPNIETDVEFKSDELVPTFKLNASDKKRVLDLCAQMRKIVLATEAFDQPHRRLLLNRIAGIEYQVEQPKGKLDILRASVSDVGETLGKFGLDIKPLTDRIKEVAQIGRSNSKQYDQIPAPDEVKQITNQSGETEED